MSARLRTGVLLLLGLAHGLADAQSARFGDGRADGSA